MEATLCGTNSFVRKVYINNKTWYNQLISYIIPFSLYFCFTNYVYLSAIGALLVVLLPFLVGEKNYRLSKNLRNILISISVFLLLCIVSSLIVQPKQLLTFDFYRRDGNVFISYLPLIVLCCSAINFNVWKIIKHFVYISTVANIIGLLLHVVFKQYPEYWMFFTAHNAAGGFLGMLCVFNFALMLKTKHKGLLLICLLINFIGLFLTNSRGSLIPVLIAFIYYLVCLKKKLKNFDLAVNVLFFIAMFVITFFIAGVRRDDVFVHINSYTMPNEFKGGIVDLIVTKSNRGGTIVDRIYYLYPRALYMFAISPLFGVGMGAFNDLDFNFSGIKNFLFFNSSNNPEFNSAHAHNSFFHILAENGLIGFILIIFFILSIRTLSKRIKDKHLGILLFLSVNYVVWTSFFEHRLFTPAEILPFAYVVGIIISKENYKRRIYYAKKCNSNK